MSPDGLSEGGSQPAQIVHDADCATKGLGESKAAADGVGIGVPVTEIEYFGERADVIAILLLADAHGFA